MNLSCLLLGCMALVGIAGSPEIVNVGPSWPPYRADSPWNLAIGPRPDVDPLSDRYIDAMHGPFGCNPDRYTIPVYEVDGAAARETVRVDKYFSRVSGDGDRLDIDKDSRPAIPWPANALPAAGTDANLVVLDPVSGDEWGLWQLRRIDGGWTAVNGYHYNIRWSGVPPQGFRSRGAGVPYLAGLVRPREIAEGRIRHTLAFGVNYPSDRRVFPATKTDSTRDDDWLLPMGSRLQLDPALGEEDFRTWGLDRTGMIIARALQEYGMILVSGSGHPKIYVESSNTADWRGILDKNTVAPIPYAAFRLLALDAPPRPEPVASVSVTQTEAGVQVSFPAAAHAGRYRIVREEDGQRRLLTETATGGSYLDATPSEGLRCRYLVTAVSRNGVSDPVASEAIVVRRADLP
ncbi:MAG: hypothetical protein AB1568_11205 [Thermodesulfobacteriota bacterium]